jgi:hypothetical protein
MAKNIQEAVELVRSKLGGFALTVLPDVDGVCRVEIERYQSSELQRVIGSAPGRYDEEDGSLISLQLRNGHQVFVVAKREATSPYQITARGDSREQVVTGYVHDGYQYTRAYNVTRGTVSEFHGRSGDPDNLLPGIRQKLGRQIGLPTILKE